MDNPEIKDTLGGYELSWSDIKLRITVTKIKQHRDNRVTGWLMIYSSKKAKERLLHQADLNFASTQTQKSLANSLRDRYDKDYEEYEWDDIIESLRYFVLERVRQGEPVQQSYSDDEDIEPPTYLIHPIMPENQPTVIFGEPGAGKSRMAQILYIVLTLPWYNNPLGLVAPPRPIRPLILDYESDEDTVKWRMKCLQLGLDLPPIPISYRRCLLPIADDIEAIQEAMVQVGAEALIIDSIAAAVGGDLLDIPSAMRFFTTIRQLKTTALCIGQTQKDPEKKKKTIYGAGIYEYYSRSIWECRKAQTQGENEMHIALHHRKANEDMLHRPYAFHIYFNESKTTVTQERAQDIPEFQQDMPIKPRMLEELGHGSLTAKELAENIDVSGSLVSKYLTQMKAEKKVVKLANNRWGKATEE